MPVGAGQQVDQQSEDAVAEVWTKLAPGLVQIYNLSHDITKIKYMEFYNLVFNFCTRRGNIRPFPSDPTIGQSDTQKLYEKVRQWLKDYLSELLRDGEQLTGDSLLRFYTSKWDNYKFSSKVLDGVMKYMNQHWVQRVRNDKKDYASYYVVYDLTLFHWREKLFSQVTPAVLSLIEKDRNGELVDQGLVKSIVDSCVELGIEEPANAQDEVEQQTAQRKEDICLSVYRPFFEKQMLEAAELYFAAEASRLTSELEVTEYMKRVEKRIDDETRRVELTMHPTTLKPLLRVVEKTMIEQHLPFFCSEFLKLLQANEMEHLTRMYKLLHRVPDSGLPALREEFKRYVTSQGDLAVSACADKAAADPKLYTDTLLSVHNKYSALVKEAFLSDPGFTEAMGKAVEYVVNKNAVTESGKKSALLLVRYIDNLLKKGGKSVVEGDELDATLSDIVLIFRYVEDKDVFQRFFNQLLAQRLVKQKSVSDEAEALIISKLKTACGVEYTMDMERMLNDMRLSADMNAKFKDQNSESLGFEFSIHVLTTGSWPVRANPASDKELMQPPQLEKAISRFTAYYLSQHSGRKLHWVWQHSFGELKFTNQENKVYTFTVSTWQMVLMLQFNDATALTIGQLMENTGISVDTLKQVVKTLLQIRLLSCDSLTPQNIEAPESAFSPATILKVCDSYKNKKFRMDINVPLRAEVKRDEERVSDAETEKQRAFVIRAAIVRIMKARQKLKHNQLMVEVPDQLKERFVPKVPSIKKQIEVLIEQEYIRRGETEETKDEYQYVA